MNDQHSSNTIWYVVGAVVIVALGYWYFSASTPAPTTGGQAMTETPATDTTTVADISAELNAMATEGAQLDQASAASAAEVKSF